MIHHLTRATKHLIFWSLILTAITLSALRLGLKGVENYRMDLESHISGLLGVPVKLGSLRATMRGVTPQLIVKDIQFNPATKGESPLSLQEIRLGLDLAKFLWQRDSLASSFVTVVGAKLQIYRQPDGEIAIEGLKAGKGQPLWLLQGSKYELLNSQVTWQDYQKQAKPLVLDHVNVVVMNNGKHHQLNALAKSPDSLGASITAIVEFEGEASKVDDIKGNIYIRGEQIKLQSLLSPYLPPEFRMTKGISDFSIWGKWQHGGLAELQTDARLQDAVFTKKDVGNLQVNALDTHINWRSLAKEWQLDIARFVLESASNGSKSAKKWPDAVLSIVGDAGADTAMKKLKLFVKQLDLAEATALVQFFVPANVTSHDQLKLLAQSQLRGAVKEVSVFVEPEKNEFAVSGWFDNVSFAPITTAPGLAKLSGKINGDQNQGLIEIASQNSELTALNIFEKPLKLNKINGILSWRQTDGQWRIASPAIKIDTPAFNSESRLAVEIPKNQDKPFLDLQITFNSDDIKPAIAFIPVKIMPEKLKNWLTNAFVNGKVSKGDFLIYGKTSEFPYIDGTGVFEGKLAVVAGELNYHPNWPKISGINGTVAFSQNNIIGNFNRGIIEKATINKAEMLVSGMGVAPYLSIKGQGQGEVNQGLAVLTNSPFAVRVTPLLANLKVQGDIKTDLELGIPLVKDQEVKVEGKVEFANNQMVVNRLGLNIDQIRGDLKFNKTGVYGEKIQGVALGHPIQANIAQEEQQTLIDVNGAANVKDVVGLFRLPEAQMIEGESDYLLQLKLPKVVDANNPLGISVKSTMEGVALNVPGLLVKTKEQQKPTVFNAKFTGAPNLPIDLDFNSELKAAINLNMAERKLESGHILFGKGEAKQRNAPGIKLEIGQEHLALQNWLGMVANQKPDAAKSMNINEIKIHSLSAYWQKTRLGAFYLSLKRNASDWDGEIDSAFGRGKFQLPIEKTEVNPVLLDMDMLNITALKQLKLQEGTTSANNSFKPLINIKSKKTLWQSEDLGKLSVQTERKANGIKIKKLELLGEDEKLFLMGDWQETGIKSITNVTGKLEMRKADELFDRLNITKDLTSTSGTINFKLHWNAPPWYISFPTLHGTVDAKLKEGRILSIEPGFGRVLGILAVAQWIKRLQLDFSDIYEEGLSFNSIKGHFDVINGNAQTKALVIDAIPATITISGDTDLVKQTVNHVIKVVPKSLDAVPIAGTIVSKIASVLGETITGKNQDGFLFGTEYLVKGSWNDIKISKSHENAGLVHKTWRSITEFPWDE